MRILGILIKTTLLIILMRVMIIKAVIGRAVFK